MIIMEYRFCATNGERYAEMVCLGCDELGFEAYDDERMYYDYDYAGDCGENEDDPCGCRECEWNEA